jgi:putative transposase
MPFGLARAYARYRCDRVAVSVPDCLPRLKGSKGCDTGCPGLGAEVLRRPGALVMPLPGSEIVPARPSGLTWKWVSKGRPPITTTLGSMSLASPNHWLNCRMRENQAAFPIATMCRLLGVSPSGYYAWTKRQPSRRAQKDAALVAEIRAAYSASRGTYGAPRIHIDLAAKGIRVGRKRVARLMSVAGLAGVSRRKFVHTTVKGSDRQAPDLVERNFTAERPNLLWVADITYIPTWTGFLYLAVVLDADSRRIVGWSMATTPATWLVLDALNMALATRRPKGVIHHSDQGSQYTSIEFGHRCREAGVRPSMGSVGDAYDNAMTLECELLDQRRFKTQAEGADRRVRIHRGLLQPAPASFVDRVSLPDRLRASSCGQSRRTPACRRARGGQGQALRAAPKWGRP